MRRRLLGAPSPVHRHSLGQVAVDALAVALAYLLAFELRFDGDLPARYDDLLRTTVGPIVLGSLAVFALGGLYQRWWRFLGPRDFEAVARAVVIATILLVGAIALLHPVEFDPRGSRESVGVNLPLGVAVLWFLLTLGLMVGARYGAQALFVRPGRGFKPVKGARDVLIVGAGDGGQLVLREVVRNPELGYRPVGFVDDDPRKARMRLDRGLKVLGTTSEADLDRVLDETEPDEVIIAIPSAPGTLRARVVSACRKRGIPARTTPTVFELLRGGPTVLRQVRDIQVEDVLGREPVRMELERVGAYLADKTVVVTGAGGSIGAELCRQIARVGPRRLLLIDHAEDNLFEIRRELEEDRHFHRAHAVLADCKEEERMREALTAARPDVVFHAAAYKHVRMMEDNPVEAVRNNALATRLVARICGELGVGAFVLISTDKAVAPATVMGASKALAEWAVEAAAHRWPDTRFASVRFGNVLGSSGSVVPIFRRQIAAGGPITVTDSRMTRYFMTIPEAVQLVIRAGSLQTGSGSVFVLDMGEPVRIVDLAQQMIRLSGLDPDRDIGIEEVGRRPGEKLHEDLFNPYELPQPTPVERILRAEREPLDQEWVESTFEEINLLVLEEDAAGLARKVAELSSHRFRSVASGPAPAGDAAGSPS